MCVGRFDLVFDLEAREQGHVFAIKAQLLEGLRRHKTLHVLLRLLKGRGVIDEDFADVIGQVVAHGASDRIAFLIEQEGGRPRGDGAGDGVPLRAQVVHVPLQLFGTTAHAGGADDGAHAVRDLQLRHGLAHLIAVFAFDATRHAATARVVGHQHQKAAGQTDEGGQCGAFVTALFLLDLHDDFLAFRDQFADRAVLRAAGTEIVFGDFFQRQKAMPRRAVIDEAGFQ